MGIREQEQAYKMHGNPSTQQLYLGRHCSAEEISCTHNNQDPQAHINIWQSIKPQEEITQ